MDCPSADCHARLHVRPARVSADGSSLNDALYMVHQQFLGGGLMLKVVFFRNARGRVPVLEWLRELSPDDRKTIGTDLLRVQENWPIGMPICRSLGKGLWEVRTPLAGNRTARLVFGLAGSEIFVLHAFFKTTQKTPAADISLARSRMKEVLS